MRMRREEEGKGKRGQKRHAATSVKDYRLRKHVAELGEYITLQSKSEAKSIAY